MRVKACRLFFFAPFILFVLCILGCSPTPSTVIIFHAGSLGPLVREVANRFEEHHPGVKILAEATGSLDAVRKVSELGKPCDLLATADDRLLSLFQLPVQTQSYAFLGNEMVLATSHPDLFQDPASRAEWGRAWFELLFLDSYSYGISDPERDPAGYYSHLLWKLAEVHYNRPGLYRRISVRLDPAWTRPKSSELIALLEAGALDFAFIYRSSAFQNNLEYITLPPEISMGEPSYRETYGQVFVEIPGSTPGEKIELTGAPIRYGVALLNPDNRWATRFLETLLSEETQRLARELGYTEVPVEQLRNREGAR